ncbi:hypothetical protein HOC80_04960 [archaeon]|jgi:hypothetical protein|nr:hypothetical protein [archaeon]MBT4417423.1 hypothetical protein [archaeon]
MSEDIKIKPDQITDVYSMGNQILGVEVFSTDNGGTSYFVCGIEDNDVEEIMDSLSIEEILYLEHRHKGLYLAAKRWDVDTEAYIGDVDLVEHVEGMGCKTLEELRIKSPRAGDLLANRELEDSLFDVDGNADLSAPYDFPQEE